MEATFDKIKSRARQLDDMPWRTLFGYGWAVISTSVLLMLVVPVSWHPAVKAASLALPLLFIVAKDLAQLPRVLGALRDLRARRAGPMAKLAACLPPALIGMARLDRRLWRGFFGWLRRVPPAARPDGLKLRFDGRSAYSAAFAFALISLLIELPLDAAIMPLLVRDPAKVHTLHWLFGLCAAYSLVWLLGDRWLLRGGHHVLTETDLDLEIGGRASARIPLAAIEDARPLSEGAEQWRKRHALRHAETVNITPLDKPNLVLRLAPGTNCTILHHGQVRRGVSHVFLYLDHPAQLLAALAARSAAPR